MSIRFDVALSFAGDKKRDKVRKVAEILRQQLGDEKVFFDEWFEHEIAGPDAQTYLQTVYGKRSQLVVACICDRYAEKPWTQDEWRAIQAFERGLRDAADENQKRSRLLLLRFGDGSVDGVFSTAVVPDVRNRSAENIADLILKRLRGSRRLDAGGPRENPPSQPAAELRSAVATPLAGGQPPSSAIPPLTEWNLHSLQRTEHRLQGRSAEMSQLTTAWSEPKGRVVAIEGPGGAGKTALVRAFLDQLRLPGTMQQAEKVYGWTFHNQGQEDFQSTAIGFVRDALRFFGLPPDALKPFSELTSYLRNHRCILVLDGLETQPRDANGDLTQYNNEEGLRSFLQELCENDLPKGGLVLITSKERVNEIKPDAWNTDVISVEGLGDVDGAALLQAWAPQRSSDELPVSLMATLSLLCFFAVTSKCTRKPSFSGAASSCQPEKIKISLSNGLSSSTQAGSPKSSRDLCGSWGCSADP